MHKFAWLVATSVAMCGTALAGESPGDAAAGMAKADEVCSECHEKGDWAEETTASLDAKIHDVVAGKTKHKKKLTLTDKEMADLAAYWTSK